MILRQTIREAVRDGTSKVVLNLADVVEVDLYGFGEMISGYTHVRNQGGNLVFLNASIKFCKMVIDAKILTVFEFFDNEEKALKGCE